MRLNNKKKKLKKNNFLLLYIIFCQLLKWYVMGNNIISQLVMKSYFAKNSYKIGKTSDKQNKQSSMNIIYKLSKTS